MNTAELSIMAQANLEDIVRRLSALEDTKNTEDYADPVLIYENPDGTAADSSSIEKIPDIINSIPIFDGKSEELTSWIRDVDCLVKAYKTNENSTIAQKNKFYAICTIIRRKIKGEANSALVNSDVNINWQLIKKNSFDLLRRKKGFNNS